LLNLSAASPKKTRTYAVRLTGSVGVPAYEVQCAWLAKTVDCALNGKAQETPSQGWKTFLRNHAEGIASIVRGQQKETFMPDAYVIEVSGRTAGIVARDSQSNSFNFFSAAPRFNARRPAFFRTL
jgi:hypothetical protein